MRRESIAGRFALFLTVFCGLFGTSLVAQTIGICDGDTEWPPYAYFKRVDGNKTGEVIGFSIDVVREVLNENGYELTVDKRLPWSRCLRSVNEGKDFQMVINATYSEDRARMFHISEPYYSLQMGYFYSKQAHPDGLDIQNPSDVNRYTICGILGFSYDHEWLDAGRIDQGARTYAQVLEKIRRNRCDLFLEYYDVVAGLSKVGEDLLAGSDIGWKPLLGVEPDKHYIMVSKQFAEGGKLIEVINNGLAELKASGKLEALKSKSMK
jgi:polar amino acid transport system substrate-binding protein